MGDSSNITVKRRRTDPPDPPDDFSKGLSREMPFILNKLRALQKKLDSTAKENNITFKGTSDNEQIVIACNSATFELIKSIFQTSVKAQGYCCTFKTNRDRQKSVVAIVICVKSKKKGKPFFTINFYNTTSTILVNGLNDKDKFLECYSKLINQIPNSTIKNLNDVIMRSCKEAIECHKQNMTVDASVISLPESVPSVSASLQSTLSSVDMDISGQSPSVLEPSLSVSNSCKNCGQFSDSLKTLLTRMSTLENCVKQQNTMIQKFMNSHPVTETLQSEFDMLSTKFHQQLESKLEFLSNTSHSFNSNSHHTSSPNKMWSQLDHEKLNQPSTSHSTNKPVITLSSSNRKKIDNFRPENNIVIDIAKDSDIYNNFNQDVIRRTISRKYGPMIIEKINKYNYTSDRPRIMVQLRDKQAVSVIVDKWDKSLFGGSKVRGTIDPESFKVNTGLLKGVPVDADDEEIFSDIRRLYPAAESERLFLKSGSRMRLIKIKFQDSVKFNQAIDQGICLHSQGIKCHFEQLSK